MAKRKTKKTAAQQVVGTAAMGLPSPVRNAVGSRWGAPLAILVAIALFASGVVTIDWTGGRPHLKVDRERAQEVRHELRDDVEHIAERQGDDRSWGQWPVENRR
jgi:hypothetical protein